MAEPCLNCHSAGHMIDLGTIVKPGGILVDESACFDCKVVFREFSRPSTHSPGWTQERVRAAFTSRGKLNKKQLLAMKENDRNLYAIWRGMVDHLRGIVSKQLECPEYSEHACHFLYIARGLLNLLVETLDDRITKINQWLAAQEDRDGLRD